MVCVLKKCTLIKPCGAARNIFFDLRWTLICLQVVSEQMKTLIWAKTTHGVPPLLRSQNFKTVFLGSKMVHGNGNLLIFWEVQVINPPQIWKQFFLPACCMACILQPESGLCLKIPCDQTVFSSKKWFWDLDLESLQSWGVFKIGKPTLFRIMACQNSKTRLKRPAGYQLHHSFSHPFISQTFFFYFNDLWSMSEAVRAWGRPHFQKAPNLTRIFFRPNFNSKLKMWTEILLNEQWLLCFALKKSTSILLNDQLLFNNC